MKRLVYGCGFCCLYCACPAGVIDCGGYGVNRAVCACCIARAHCACRRLHLPVVAAVNEVDDYVSGYDNQV